MSNLIANIGSHLKKKLCNINPGDLRVHVKSRESYFYPDITIICGDPEFSDEKKDTVKNPSVIFEILSPSTEEYDIGIKFFFYMQIESLQQYITINSTNRHIRSGKRQSDEAWKFRELIASEDKLLIDPIQFELALNDIYEGISLPGSLI